MEKKDRKFWGVNISIHARFISHFLVNLLPLFGKPFPIFTIAKRVQLKNFKLDSVSQFSTNSIFFKFRKGGTLQKITAWSSPIVAVSVFHDLQLGLYQ